MRRRGGGLVAVLLAVSVLAPAPARAAEPTITMVGWWSRSPGQQAPAGGFAVAAAPDGPVTVAAVEVLVGDAEVFTATLSAVETGGLAQDAAALQACITTSEWQPEEGGAWEDAPEPACDGDTVVFTRDADARTWSAEIAPLLAGQAGSVSVMIVPGEEVQGAAPPAPPAPGVPTPPAPSSPSPAFDVRLAAPTLEAQATDTDDRSGAGSGPVITGNDDFSSDGEPSPDFSYAPPPAVSPTTAAAAGPADAGAPQEPVEDEAPTGEAEQRALQPLRSTGEDDSRPWGKALLYVLVASVMGAGAGLGRWVLREKFA